MKRIIAFLLVLLFSSALVACNGCGVDDGLLSYEEYRDLSGREQQEYYNTFSDVEAFFAWYNAAKAEYEAAHPGIDAGDGNIDLGELGK